MTEYVRLRAKRVPGERAQVSHIYETWDELHPYRVTLCGREVESGRLTDQDIDREPACVQCTRRLPEGHTVAREEVSVT